MARIAGVDIPREKRVEISLSYIFGIGRPTAHKICSAANVPLETKVRDLTDDEVARIREYIDKNYTVEGELRKQVRQDIQRLIEISGAPAGQSPAAAAQSPRSEELGPVAERKTRTRRREKKNVPVGRAYIASTFNNTTITLTDPNGAVLSWASAGTAGFKGSRKSTPYAAGLAAEAAARRAMEHGLRQVEVRIKGPGSGREAAIRSLQSAGLQVTNIRDVTPMPHNGCRPPKRRRV